MARSQAPPCSQYDRRRVHRTGPVRLVAFGVAVACFAAPLASLSHLAAHAHTRCQEHGELEDVPSTAHPLEILHEQASIENGAAPDQKNGHEHCLFGTHARHTQAVESAHAQGAPTLLADLPDSIQKPAPQAPRLVVYRLAPKTSPPA